MTSISKDPEKAKEMEKQETDKMIMKFMGWKVELFDPEDKDFSDFYVLNQYNQKGERIGQITGYDCANIEIDEVMSFCFWADIMPVVAKIYTLEDYRHCTAYYNLTHAFIINPVEVIYSLVVQFIEYYNQQNN